ncbi:glycosyltransferase family 2 protein [Dietzia alimentaria]|uniref:glycosyltransferase family 2 protein n=1 Tax=Dietzia alimentaria TaxID=665550 RepID=UPI00029B1F83|nr:glycosyltransferase [Dietzia alimentaria]
MSAGTSAIQASVDVVIPYYRDQQMLDRILHALRHQTGLAESPRVIVADDGSPTPPVVPPEVTVVRQEDRGFRASAARHLGARAGEGELLLFLDGDTVPEAGYVAALLAALEGNPDLLVVGRRRYGVFSDPAAAPAQPAHRGLELAEVLPDPEWPASFYTETDGLTRTDGGWRAGLWRGVLSAVCGMHRRMYDLAGGFDPHIVGYGGEDWDLAWRCEQVGGRLRYVPDAVAWHDGPDWSGRAGADDPDGAAHLAQKNAETARLAPLIASPLTRPAGGIFELPLIAVRIHRGPGGAQHGAATASVAGSGSVAATCASLLRWGDVTVSVDPDTPDAPLIAELFAADPRVRLEPHDPGEAREAAGAGLRRRPEVLVDILRPCGLGALDPDRVRALCPPVGSLTVDDDEGRVLARIRTSRALAREQIWGDCPDAPRAIAAREVGVSPFGTRGAGVRLEQVLGGW